jgi:hypothetical protein
MRTLFDPPDRDALLARLSGLQPSSPRQWGKMTIAQMLAHCSITLEVPCGDRVKTQRLLGRVFGPFVRSSALGDKPFPRGAPTDPEYKIVDQRDFDAEKSRLVALVNRFCARGPQNVDGIVHAFFGRLTADQWGRLMYKHLDHHLRQFSA